MSKEVVWRPRRVEAGVISETFGDGTAVVVQLDSQQAHSLDALAARVWELADGTRSVTSVALAVGAPVAAVEATLVQLADLGLLEDDAVGGHSRRSVLARAAQVGGGLVLAGGVINSMALPAAAAAVSPVDSYLTVMYLYSSGGPFAPQGNYYYTPSMTNYPQLFANPIYLTDTGESGTQPSNSTPYVTITPISTGEMNGMLTLTFNQVSGASASYGSGGESNADTSLVAGNATPVSVPSEMEVTVTIGT